MESDRTTNCDTLGTTILTKESEVETSNEPRHVRLEQQKAARSGSVNPGTTTTETSESGIDQKNEKAHLLSASKQDILAARRNKLAQWKKRKIEADKEEQKKRAGVTPPPSKKPKNKKRGKRNPLENSDETVENIIPSTTAAPLFRPDPQDTIEHHTLPQQHDKEDPQDTIEHHTLPQQHDKEDPLDSFMESLQNEEQIPDATDLTRASVDLDADELDQNTIEEDETVDEESGMQESKLKTIAKAKLLRKVLGVDYTTMELEHINKSLYHEPESLKNLSQEDMVELRFSLGNIKVKGENCPKPATRWSQLGLDTSKMNLIENVFKFDSLTPIQAQALPAIMSGRDVIGISKTGSGKTISYLLPLLRHIKAQRPLSKNETGPLALIIAPTRELALQIYQETLRFLDSDKSLRAICCTGGSQLKTQINDLKRGTEIVVATPGRFIDLLTMNSGKLISSKKISFVVLDEADRLFDMGFEPQVTQIMKTIRPDKQCVLFSATFPNKLRNFAMRVLKSPLSITINSNTMVNENVTQKVELCNNELDKFDILLSLLEKHQAKLVSPEQDEKVIIFVASQQICDTLYAKLENYDYDLFAIHAGKSYQERITNLNKFKETANSILICTEVLSRGLNVPEVSLVVIFNAIKTFAQYVHTTGRTARGNNHGDAITLLLKDDLAGAFIVFKAMREKDFEKLSLTTTEELGRMCKEFEKGVKSGKFKLLKGFGGKGLDNLDTKREEKQALERKAVDGVTNETPIVPEKSAPNLESTDKELGIPKLTYDVKKIVEEDGSTTFTAQVNVNDLPKLVRWEATKKTTLLFIKNETGCSITTRGKFYPENKAPQTVTDEPKLYLLLECQDEKDIKLSIELLEEKVKEGIRKIEYQTLKSNKF
ncbi:DEAD-box RNA helicase PRP5 KNAG_0M00660 [Huiozyma naganishii CBS 8797]|uniref:RNA helicase n=1 Tax=Huiozyma naganishii (strain ATCC MYA-139 / BCRC 22969 / CBS 8797 / KCTC 17520 / NBRC 10181 / NCYC 3082 / Yp74L-3) TaxID=1071383 RepID=J7SAP4_HUIN7|nr:hypothetical protein KNAG_0M00660 [Kazachstania naganishii CBS 8797]CCK72919.1 hypothetical protein KNAG_0M00660 [Kazachstania naganishii CBS 8797]